MLTSKLMLLQGSDWLIPCDETPVPVHLLFWTDTLHACVDTGKELHMGDSPFQFTDLHPGHLLTRLCREAAGPRGRRACCVTRRVTRVLPMQLATDWALSLCWVWLAVRLICGNSALSFAGFNSRNFMDLHVIGRETLLASDCNSVSFSLEKLTNVEGQILFWFGVLLFFFLFLFKDLWGFGGLGFCFGFF